MSEGRMIKKLKRDWHFFAHVEHLMFVPPMPPRNTQYTHAWGPYLGLGQAQQQSDMSYSVEDAHVMWSVRVPWHSRQATFQTTACTRRLAPPVSNLCYCDHESYFFDTAFNQATDMPMSFHRPWFSRQSLH